MQDLLALNYGNIDTLIVIAYLLITLGIGLYYSTHTASLRDYALAGRNFKTITVVSTVCATMIGGFATMGIASRVFSIGPIYIIVAMGMSVCFFLVATFIAPRVSHTCAGAISVGDIVAKYYGTAGRLVAGTTVLLTAIGGIAIQVKTMGHLFHYFLGISPVTGVIVGCGIVLFYTAFGGMRTVTMTDVFQFAILIVAIPIVCNMGLNKIGGYDAILPKELGDIRLVWDHVDNIWYHVTLTVIFTFSFFEPILIQRLLLSRNSRQAINATKFSAMISVPLFIMIGLIGLVALHLNPTLSPEFALPYVMDEVLPMGVRGFVIAGMLAVIMSTADSNIHIAGVTLIQDIVRPLIHNYRISEKNELRMARLFTFFLGLSTLIVALLFDNIMDIVVYSFNFWMPIVLVPLIALFFGVTVERHHFMLGVLSGFMSVLLWNHLLPHITLMPLAYLYQAINKVTDCSLPASMVHLGVFGFFVWKERHLRPAVQKKPSTPMQANPWVRAGRMIDRYLIGITYVPAYIVAFSHKRVQDYGAQYVAFGAFIMVNFFAPFFMWSTVEDTHQYYVLLALRISGGLFCFALIMKDTWPIGLRKQYLPLFWHVTVLYCLPVVSTYTLLASDGVYLNIINAALSLMMMAVLVDWLSFIILAFVGMGLGYFLFSLVNEGSAIHFVTADHLYLGAYMCTFMLILGGIFGRNREFIHLKVIQLLEAKVSNRTLHLQKALAIKTDFLNNISHEVRTPIQAVTAISEVLYNDWQQFDEKKRYELTGQICANSKRLFMLVNDILDVAKYESGRVVLNIRMHNLTKILDYTVQECYLLIGTKPIEIRLEVPEGPHLIPCDDIKIAQVVRNLLINAIKYSSHGTITISVTYTPRDAIVAIRDQGIGIPDGELHYIFEPFAESSRTRTKAGGSGLGLSIARNIIMAHNGYIWAENNPDGGALFSFSIPLPHVYNLKNKPLLPSSQAPTVLVIDDEPACLVSLQLILESSGYTVILADSGAKGLEYAEKNAQTITMILLDMMMPDMYGLNVIDHLRTNPVTRNIPVIVQTGYSDPVELEKALERGVKSYITKPYNREVLLDIISHYA